MRVTVACDKFKGTLSAQEVCQIIKSAFKMAIPDSKIFICPVADGGEGTLDLFVKNQNYRTEEIIVSGPNDIKIPTYYGISKSNSSAIIETAKICGIQLLQKKELDPKYMTTYGVGEAIKHALDKGLNKFIISLGGSCTNDGGAGILQALGAKLYDKNKNELTKGGIFLRDLDNIDVSELDQRFIDSTFILATDVKNPFLGKNGATYTYATQKGASQSDLYELEEAMENYYKLTNYIKTWDPNKPGLGAAGGMAIPFCLFSNAQIKSGTDVVFDIINLESFLKNSDIVITGEGSMDNQTKYGKAPYEVAKLAKTLNPNTTIIGISGKVSNQDLGLDEFFDSVFSTITDFDLNIEDIRNNSKTNLYKCALNIAKLINSVSTK